MKQKYKINVLFHNINEKNVILFLLNKPSKLFGHFNRNANIFRKDKRVSKSFFFVLYQEIELLFIVLIMGNNLDHRTVL